MDILFKYHFLSMKKLRMVNMPLEKQIITKQKLAFVAGIVEDNQRTSTVTLHFSDGFPLTQSVITTVKTLEQ